VRYDPAKPYDAGHAFAMYALVCRRPSDFHPRAAAVIAGTKLERMAAA